MAAISRVHNLNYIKELKSVDWDFKNVKNGGINHFHWYPATFPSAIPGTLIPILSSPGDIVVDPFSGSSTTGIEAVRLGRNIIGFDTNPVAVLLSRAKHYFPTKSSIYKEFKYDEYTNDWPLMPSPKTLHPQEEELLQWYHPRTYKELLYLLEKISKIKNSKLRESMQAVLSSILKSTCSQTKHWGWICDNVKPKKGDIQYKNAFVAFDRAIEKYLEASEVIISDMKHKGIDSTRKSIRKRSEIKHIDCNSGLERLKSESVDLILTSPPYNGVADYIKSQRLSYLWFDHEELDVLGYNFASFNELRKTEMGSRSHRYRKNSFDVYINYMNRFFLESRRVIKPEGKIALILGESKARKATIEEIIESAISSGFEVVYRSERDIKPSRARLMAKVKNEDVIVFTVKNNN